MYPAKSVTDYLTEMNRLFPRIDENDYLSPPNTRQSFSHSMKSSSSAETSPDSFPDVMRELFPGGVQSPVRPDQSPAKPDQTLHRLGDRHRLDYFSNPREIDSTLLSQSMYETPLIRNNRPVIGRKIITPDSARYDETLTICQDLQQTPPNSSTNSFYELFPTKDTPEFKPVQNFTPPKLDYKPNMDRPRYDITNESPRYRLSNDTSPNYQKSNEMSPKYQMPYDFNPKYQKMTNDTMPRYDRMSNSRFESMTDSPRYDQILNECSRYGRMSNDIPRNDRMSNYTPRYDRMSNDTPQYDNLSKSTARYHQMSNDFSPRNFQTPIDTSQFDRMSSDTASQYNHMSNDFQTHTMSREISPIKMSLFRSRSNSSLSSQRFSTPFKEPIITPSTSKNGNKMCTFCRKNGETPLVYMTHRVKEKVDGKNVVTCPILRSHVCNSCGASGDDAHTISYCPVMKSCNNGRPLHSTTVTLKNTRVKSNGRRRF